MFSREELLMLYKVLKLSMTEIASSRCERETIQLLQNGVVRELTSMDEKEGK